MVTKSKWHGFSEGEASASAATNSEKKKAITNIKDIDRITAMPSATDFKGIQLMAVITQ